MGNIRIYSIHLKDGTVVIYRTPYNYFDHGSIIESIENADDDDIISIRNSLEEELLIPKKNISFIKVGLDKPGTNTKEAQNGKDFD